MCLKINRKTVAHRLQLFGKAALYALQKSNEMFHSAWCVQFDDLETFEHSRLKPLSVTVAVEKFSRRILGFTVSRMPAKGPLAERSLKKYGQRVDERPHKRRYLFNQLKSIVQPEAIFESDQCPQYYDLVREFFPQSRHVTQPSRKACVVGQGELKEGGFDPLFSINHTLAMFRANINRLFRRTWNTTKKPECLQHHIALYALFHNWCLI
ncbi:MAG: hypothetical protein NZ480_03795 [Bdellovibrionaceae bacterium]|nr:hypothetical protein [Pseudobdellovibrionaceae bacterium]MDW8190034.1 hypothetical protein [Pseudobdellovibrionaceae bacterium]